MPTDVEELVEAASHLDADQFLRFRQELDRLERRLWETERDRVAGELDAGGLTDERIDELVVRRRRESRP